MRAVLDALHIHNKSCRYDGRLFLDDGQVVSSTLSKRWSKTGRCGAHIVVEAMEEEQEQLL
jgi:Holliday junction resolvase RusA-like endonuclease